MSKKLYFMQNYISNISKQKQSETKIKHKEYIFEMLWFYVNSFQCSEDMLEFVQGYGNAGSLHV